MMLREAPIYVDIPVLDYRRAKHFYEGVLGFELHDIEGIPDNGWFEAGKGTLAYLYQRGPSHAEHTLATFVVSDLDSTVRTLRDHGVVFEEYDIPELGIKTVDGVAVADAMKTAWFKDSEGNILSITEIKEGVMSMAA
jgi:predicted enzyme related to lactoylglutathione lyase